MAGFNSRVHDVTFSAAENSSPLGTILGEGVLAENFHLAAKTTGSPTAASVKIQGTFEDPRTGNWFDISSPFNVPLDGTSGNFQVDNTPVQHARLVAVGLSGGTDPTIVCKLLCSK